LSAQWSEVQAETELSAVARRKQQEFLRKFEMRHAKSRNAYAVLKTYLRKCMVAIQTSHTTCKEGTYSATVTVPMHRIDSQLASIGTGGVRAYFDDSKEGPLHMALHKTIIELNAATGSNY
jgi:predicted RNA-binding Zn ribbon-like protein